jgi:anti-anti-sigma regulatory factor
LLRPRVEPSTTVLVIDGPIALGDIPGFCEEVRLLLAGSDADLVVCDVGALAEPDAVAVEALARLQLAARRLGRRVSLRDPSPELQELLAFMGLSRVLRYERRLRVGPEWQTEEREQALGIEEEGELDDSAA